MFNSLIKKIFGSRNDRLLKQYSKIVTEINQLEDKFKKLSDDVLKNYCDSLKARYQSGETLDELLAESFALVREVSKRTMNMRHFDSQLIGGIALFSGKIAEMRTGEGKTLVATLPACLNAISGNSTHIVTVNDYLAKRDAAWMQPIYNALGLSVGVIVHGLSLEEKQQAYKADIVYGTNNEFGFDYLRDNMAFEPKERMQGKLSFAIVDEVDSILIDEARTPLIISGAAKDSSELYKTVNKIIPQLKPEDYNIDEKDKQAFFTEDGHQKVEDTLVGLGLLQPGESLYDAQNIKLMHHLYSGLRAHLLYKRDVDYIVRDDEVIIVDEHTGRTMPGRRWSEGLHQAVEAKENVKIQNENQTLASITFQNYFRLYDKLSGMTGTADTEAYEFAQIYNLEVVVIPSNRPSKRIDLPDLIYLTVEEKFEAIIEDIKQCVAKKQPVLVGTISIETSEYLSNLLRRHKIEHKVLNAKFHEQEAEIIAEAGRPGRVTIATNMAGRGTDIVLGGAEKDENWQARHEQVVSLGGLHVIGTERHESRRIDNQLRGRCARQGDPGSTQFYLSIKDNLMRIFISDNISAFLNKLGMQKGEAITASLVTRAVENAQRKVEGHNFDIRKQLIDYDNVANDQRKVVYRQRDELMEVQDISDTVSEMQDSIIQSIVEQYIPPQSMPEQWHVEELEQYLANEFGQHLPIKKWIDDKITPEDLILKLQEHLHKVHAEKTAISGEENMRNLEKVIMLSVLDNYWKEHLANMDYIRQSIHLRGYAQKDPKQEYKREAFMLFTEMLDSIKQEVVAVLAKMHVQPQTDVEAVEHNIRQDAPQLEYNHAPAESLVVPDEVEHKIQQHVPHVRDHEKVGRNDPCPCGSGRKYKVCHGSITKVGA